MRCYLMRSGRIFGVELLEPGSDEALVRQAEKIFRKNPPGMFDGFEVWDKARPVHRFPPEESVIEAAAPSEC